MVTGPGYRRVAMPRTCADPRFAGLVGAAA